MKNKNNFILLDLDDDKTNEITNAVSSKSGKKILKYLEENEKATQTQISKGLVIPAPTVKYTIEQLLKAKLIEDTHYHLSEKGREVKHYSLANKIIIIAPKRDESFLKKINDLIGSFILALIGSVGIFLYSNDGSVNSIESQAMPMVADYAFEESTFMARSKIIEEVPQATVSEPNLALYFLAGASFVVIVSLFIRYIKRKK